MLLRLPAVLLAKLCNFLLPRELLITLARTAKTTRSLLTPACFSSHWLELGSRELLLLSHLLPPSSVAQPSFHSYVLSDSPFVIDARGSSIRRVLDSLDHFDGCKSLSLCGDGMKQLSHPENDGSMQLTDAELHGLLLHPTTLAYHELALWAFIRPKAEMVLLADGQSQQSQADRRLARSTRHSSGSFFKTLFSRKKPFDWADIRLPSVQRLSLVLHGQPMYTGGAAFLTAHTAVTHLRISTLLVSVDELTDIFQDPAALPQLACLGLFERDHTQRREMDMAPLLICSRECGDGSEGQSAAHGDVGAAHRHFE